MSENKFITHKESAQYGDSYLGQVVRILDKYSIIVSTARSIKAGAIVQVFDIGENLTGLNGENLGNYIYVKATLSVEQVEPRYCICKVIPEEKVRPLLASPFTDLTQTTKIHHPLSVNDDDIKKVPQIDMHVNIGDKVRKA